MSVPALAALAPLAAFAAIDHVVLLACALFAVGLIGVTCRRNILVMLLSVEIMLNAGNLALVAFSRLHANLDGQVFVFFTMTVAAAEVAVGLAIVIALYRLRRTTDVAEVNELHEMEYGPVPTLRLEGEDQHHHDEHAGAAPSEAPSAAPSAVGAHDEAAPHDHGAAAAGRAGGHA